MKKNILVSIIIPIYNVEGYLYRCLDSLISQTYEEIEILCINDGSTDNSSNIIEYFIKKDRRVKSFLKANGGLSDARNYGLKNASGCYICFVDGDDYVDDNFIKELLNSIESEKSDIACCEIKVITDEESIIKLHSTKYENKNDDYFSPISACNKMYKLKLFVDNNIYFPRGLAYEDYATIPKLISLAKVSYVDKPLYNYIRNRSNSIMNTISPRIMDILTVSIMLFNWNEEMKLIESKILENIIMGRIIESYIQAFLLDKKTLKDYRNKIKGFLDSNIHDWKKNSYFKESSFIVVFVRESLYKDLNYVLLSDILFKFFIYFLKRSILKRKYV